MTPSPRTNKGNDQQEYFLWLCGLVDIGATDHGRRELLWILFNEKFVYKIPKDDNRAADGLDLRERWRKGFHYNAPCSVLEMLIALAYRMDFNISEVGEPEKPGKWFWEMIENLRLEEFTGRKSIDKDVMFQNMSILDTWLQRTYHPNGRGGLFPLRNPQKDQRKVEIWYQMMFYIMENYF